jgi:hypothetical protein
MFSKYIFTAEFAKDRGENAKVKIFILRSPESPEGDSGFNNRF